MCTRLWILDGNEMNVTGSITVGIDDAAAEVLNAMKSLPPDAKVKSFGTTGMNHQTYRDQLEPAKKTVTITFEWVI